jgi:hypothetical protein
MSSKTDTMAGLRSTIFPFLDSPSVTFYLWAQDFGDNAHSQG